MKLKYFEGDHEVIQEHCGGFVDPGATDYLTGVIDIHPWVVQTLSPNANSDR